MKKIKNTFITIIVALSNFSLVQISILVLEGGFPKRYSHKVFHHTKTTRIIAYLFFSKVI
eukprot:UN15430